MTDPQDTGSNGNIRVILALIALAVVVAVYVFGATSLSTVFGSRHGYRPSPDEDGNVELTLRYSKTLRNPQHSEWRLRLPAEYINLVIGDLDNVGPSKTTTPHLVGALKNLIAEGEVYEPVKDRYQPGSTYIYLSNTAAFEKVTEAGGCLTSFESSKALEAADLPVCDTANCWIYDDVDGWRAEFLVPKLASKNPQPVCTVLRRFLNTHTEHRDKIPN